MRYTKNMENFSRREFLKKLLPDDKIGTEYIPIQEIKNSNIEQPTLSRRAFLKFVGGIGVALAMERVGAKTAEAQNDKESAKKDKESSYAETAIEQSLMMGASAIAGAIFEKLKIKTGNKSLSEEEIIKYFRDDAINSLFYVGILGPAVEEALFRALPSRGLIDKNDKRQRWDIGIPTSLLFALAHNFREEESGELQFVKSVPVSQFMGGLFWWYLMRVKGYSHAAIAHSMNNTIAVSIGILLFKAYPEEKATKIVKKIFFPKENNRIPGNN